MTADERFLHGLGVEPCEIPPVDHSWERMCGELRHRSAAWKTERAARVAAERKLKLWRLLALLGAVGMAMSGFTEEWLAQRLAALRTPYGGVLHNEAEINGTAAEDVPEALIEAECTKLLEEDGWRSLRTDPVSDRGRGKGFGEPGMADHMYARYRKNCPSHPDRIAAMRSGVMCGSPLAELMWIEFKRPGEKPKKHQELWHQKERARGALTLIAGADFDASVIGFQNWYEKSGLMRRSKWW